MASLSLLVFFPLLILLFFGKLFPYIDVFIILFAITNIFAQKKIDIRNIYLAIFTLIAVISNFININLLSFLYLLRLISLISLFIVPPKLNLIQNKFINLILFCIVIFGLVQYFVWPDLTIMSSHNWDPHLYRLVGSYFDPTFTALILLFILIYLYFSKLKLKIIYLFFTYLSLSLTYSRSALISFLLVFTYISLVKNNVKIFFISILIVCATLFILPRMPGEGTKLERTSSILAKIENYKLGLKLYLQHPFTGIGYNNIPNLNRDPTSHSNSGYDGSLLTIAITTGIFGLLFLILGIRYEFIHGSLLYRSLLIAILIHSLFANSLFYPYTTLLLVLLNSKFKSDRKLFPRLVTR